MAADGFHESPERRRRVYSKERRKDKARMKHYHTRSYVRSVAGLVMQASGSLVEVDILELSESP